MKYSMNKINRQNTIETIRNENIWYRERKLLILWYNNI
jgi:hypothetical protein